MANKMSCDKMKIPMENQCDMVAPKYKIWLDSCSNAAGGGDAFNAVDLVFPYTSRRSYVQVAWQKSSLRA